VTFDTAGGTGSGVCGIDLVFRMISNRVGGVRWCVRQSNGRRDFDHDIALVNADAELDAIVTRRSDISLGHAALPLGRATQCIDNTGEFDQQPITSSFDYPAPVCVFRAFTSAAVALANGASKIVMVRTVKEALELRQAGIGEICVGELHGRAPDGFDFGNSPFEISDLDFGGKTIIQRTSAGTEGDR